MPDCFEQLSPEEKLLISLCRINFSKEHRKEIREQINGVKDWEHFVNLANMHGLIALVWHNISEAAITQPVPSEYLNRLHSGFMESLTRNTFLLSLLKEVSSLAREENIKLVLLKGIALEKTIYGNKGLRQMTDIDILVKEEDAIKLRQILIKNGFDPVPMISPLHNMMSPYWNHLPAMNRKGISVEIHFRLFDKTGDSLNNVFIEKSIPDVCCNDVFIPDPQLHFLYLVKHLAKHEKGGYSQLRLYADLVILLDAYQDSILNSKLIEYSVIAGIEDTLFQKLAVLRNFWGIKIPDLFETSRDVSQNTIALENFLQFLRHPENPEVVRKNKSLFKSLENIPGITEKILFMTGLVFPSLTYMKYRYNKKTKAGALLYYPVRWAGSGERRKRRA